MTGYTVHTGSSVKFSDGWDKIFAKGARKKASGTKTVAKNATAKSKLEAKKRGSR
jgi:hypothetical protein